MINIYDDILYDWQKNIVDKSMPHKQYGLFLTMGLGKTYVSLSIAQKKQYKKILIISPKSKIQEWEEDVKNNLGLETLVLNNSKDKDNKSLSTFTNGAIIVNYERTNFRDILDVLDEEFIMICDESHNMKHRNTKVGKWGVLASNKVGGVLLLTGTPISNSDVRQWYNQLVILGLKMGVTKFMSEFTITELVNMNGKRWLDYRGPKNLDLLHNSIKSKASFLTTEDIDSLNLPSQNFIDINLVHDKKTIYDKVKKHKIYKDLISVDTAGVMFLRLRQLSSNFIETYSEVGSHKKTALKELLESNNNNMLVFYNFNQELEDIKEVAKKLGINVYEINGQVKNIDQIDKSKQYIVCGQYLSASSGWNGQFMNNIVYYSPPLSSSDYEQSIKRIHRIGQEEKCFYYRFITKGTIEKNIYNTIEGGKNYTEELFKKDFV